MKKIPKIQIFRTFIQIISLFIVPGLFALVFSQLGQIYSNIITANFNLVKIFPNIAEFLTIFILTLVLSRFFCGWICAFGAFNDFIYIIFNKLFKVNLSINAKFDSILKYLKYLKYLVLLFIIIFMWTLGSTTFKSFSPWDAFAQILSLPEVILSYPVGLVILILIAVGAIFIERFFCRYLCPLGAVLSLISKISIFKINKPSDKCGKCRICTNNCSMGIELYKHEKVRGGECINCLKCIEKCPRNNTKTTICDENINPALASSIAIVAFTGLYSANNITGKVVSSKFPTTVSASTSTPQKKYKDGTYNGTGTGFRGGTTEVSVTVKNSKISSIETISSEDTPNYYQRSYDTIQNEIISSQSTNVDVVSGATYSSNGIISAVESALNNATATNSATSNTSNEVSTNNSSSTNTESLENNNTTVTNSEENSVNNSSNTGVYDTETNKSTYKDGTYTAVGTGFRGGTTEISITIKNGNISSIKTISSEDTPDFYERAYNTVQNEIISSQSTNVDVVSGATYSSNGIISAVKSALVKAKA